MATGGGMIQCPAHPDAPLIDDDRAGDQICSECGLVVGDRVIDVGPEWQNSSHEADNGDLSRVGATESILLNGTDLTTMIGPSPSGGNVASCDDSGAAVSKIRQKMSSSDKTLIKAFEKIRTMADHMNLGRTIVDRANQLFKQVHIGKHLKGHSTDASVATCLHIACRQEGVPQSFDDVCAVSNIHIKEIGRCFKLILEALNITVDIITTTNFIPRFCGNLNLGFPIEAMATHIGRKAVALDLVPGRSPISVAAAAIFMASHASDKQLTKKELGVGAGVAEVTIRTVYKLMRPRAAELFPEDFNLDLSKLPLS